jgi:CDP-diacylglycerol--serine O-phosphatidyltransferase
MNDNETNMNNNTAETSKATADDTSIIEEYLPIDELVEEVSEDGKRVRRKGIFLLPNLFTSAALFAGFYAIINAINGDFAAAGLAIFFGQLLDGVDGRVARMTNTQSKFGQEFDSLSDMVTFGVAPAIIVFMWCLSDLGKLGWAVAFIYVASAAIRLARFNAQAESSDNRYFTGLASPPAATLVASSVWLGFDLGYTAETMPLIMVIAMGLLTAAVGCLMVMNVRYHSFKGIDFTSRVSVVALFIFLLLLVLIASNPPTVLFILAASYAFSGPIVSLWLKGAGKDES